MTVFLYELKADLNAYLARLGPDAPVHSLKEIIEFNERNSKKEMPYFGQELFLKAEGTGPLTTDEYLDALKRNNRLSRKEGIDAVMDKDKLDALVAPTAGPAWVTDLVYGGGGSGGSSTARGGGRLSAHHRAGGARIRPARGHFVLRPGVERADAAETGLCLRAGDQLRKPPRFPPTADLRM